MAMPATTDLTGQASGMLARLKPSERRLLLGLAVVLLTVFPIKAFDAAEQAQAELTDAQAMLDRASLMARRSQGGVVGQAAAEQAQVREWSWQAEGLDVGKVQIQDQIAGMAEKAGLTDVEVKLDSKVQTAGEVVLVKMELTSNFSWTGLSGFLTALDATGKGFVIDGVVLPDDDKPRLKVALRAPLVVTLRAARNTP